jgi:ribosomal protein L3 glutamine methyltransferase
MTTAKSAALAAARRFSAAKLSHGHGAVDAFEEAVLLLAHVLRARPDRLNPSKKLNSAQARRLDVLVEARIQTRLPAAYLTGEAWLQGMKFRVDPRVIVPRSFISELLEEGIPGVDPGEVTSVLDLCSGSGCLAVLAARAFPKARVDAAELSKDACEVARVNIKESGFARRVRLYQGDLFAPLRGKKYDLIITNPPYVAPASMKKLPPEYRREPRMALEGFGQDGMEIVRRILKAAPKHLKPGGGILCEVGAGRKALEKTTKLPFLWLDTAASEGEVFWLGREDF